VTISPRAVALQGLGETPRLVAVQGLWPAQELPEDEDDTASPFTHRRRSWRPLPVEQLPPPKRKRKRRQADILFLGH
jgi:hypothetical protein